MGIQERKQREREIRRQHIMIAARRIFTKKGYESATMEDIAREAELSPGTLYLYFKNKDELYASLSIRVLQFMNVKLEHVMEPPGVDFDTRKEAVMNTLFEVYEFDPVILNNMFHLQSSETLKNLGPELLKEINDLSQKALRTLAGIFVEGQKAGIVVEAHPTALADILWSVFAGIVLWEESKKMLNVDRYHIRETIALAFEILGRGMKVSPNAPTT
ncbi:MAG: TetR/AcrR family transcriptional regulator [Desulfobacterales bacterium]|nr:TetR/AcrR family transcriptional regulator [Desulfobacterales bacterium]